MKKLSKNSKAQLKFEKVMSEFGRARRVNPDYGMKADGGKLDNIYKTGTSRQLWENWYAKQRIHFILDHADMFPELMGNDYTESAENYANMEYKDLPLEIRKEIAIHHAQGIYSKGGEVKGRGLFGLTKGEKITSVDDISIGDILLSHSKQFNSDNTIKVTDKRKYGTITHADGIYWNPNTNQRIGDEEFSIDPELGMNDYYFLEKKSKGMLSPKKQQIQRRIEVLKGTLTSTKTPEAKKSIQKRIDNLESQLNYKPTAKDIYKANTGKFVMEVPTKDARKLYKKLWESKIFPAIDRVNGHTNIILKDSHNLKKAYKVYTDMAGKVPALSKISHKL